MSKKTFDRADRGSLAKSLDSLRASGRRMAGTILVVDQYPIELTEEPTILGLKLGETRKLLFCDTEAWYEASLTNRSP